MKELSYLRLQYASQQHFTIIVYIALGNQGIIIIKVALVRTLLYVVFVYEVTTVS